MNELKFEIRDNSVRGPDVYRIKIELWLMNLEATKFQEIREKENISNLREELLCIALAEKGKRPNWNSITLNLRDTSNRHTNHYVWDEYKRDRNKQNWGGLTHIFDGSYRNNAYESVPSITKDEVMRAVYRIEIGDWV